MKWWNWPNETAEENGVGDSAVKCEMQKDTTNRLSPWYLELVYACIENKLTAIVQQCRSLILKWWPISMKLSSVSWSSRECCGRSQVSRLNCEKPDVWLNRGHFPNKFSKIEKLVCLLQKNRLDITD